MRRLYSRFVSKALASYIQKYYKTAEYFGKLDKSYKHLFI